MGTNQKNFQQDLMIAGFIGQVAGALARKAKEVASAVASQTEKALAPSSQYRRSEMYYVCPADWYNHRGRTFLKNKRKGL